MQWWSLIEESLTHNDFPNHFLQLATVKEDGSPANRTLVYRGRNEQQHILMISDARSEKFAQLIARPCAEIAWYFYDTREQYRISGDIQCLTPSDQDDDVIRLWENLSDQAKQQYFWPNPGIPIHEEADMSTIDTLENQDLTNPPMHFCVLKLVPIKVDYLKLTQPKHTHSCYVFDVVTQSWLHSLLTP